MASDAIMFIFKGFAFIQLQSGIATAVSVYLLQGEKCSLFKKWILQSYNTIYDFQLAFRLLGGTDAYVLRTAILPVNAKELKCVINL
jgi:hypothetical protein